MLQFVVIEWERNDDELFRPCELFQSFMEQWKKVEDLGMKLIFKLSCFTSFLDCLLKVKRLH